MIILKEGFTKTGLQIPSYSFWLEDGTKQYYISYKSLINKIFREYKPKVLYLDFYEDLY
jgi:hypothetical protein